MRMQAPFPHRLFLVSSLADLILLILLDVSSPFHAYPFHAYSRVA